MTSTRFLDAFGSRFHTFLQESSLFLPPLPTDLKRNFMESQWNFIEKQQGNIAVLQFHTFGTPFLKSCSCCGSKESSGGPKLYFWTQINLEHAFMLINVSPNWLCRRRGMQNRWSTIKTHSVLMILEQKLEFAGIWGQKSTWLRS